jgi:hypothetical protein
LIGFFCVFEDNEKMVDVFVQNAKIMEGGTVALANHAVSIPASLAVFHLVHGVQSQSPPDGLVNGF